MTDHATDHGLSNQSAAARQPLARDDLPALTGLRFVAALYVFVFHIHLRAPLSDEGFLANVASQGAIGMTVFFMLSGFVLAHRYGGNDFSEKEYIAARIARIYPVYIVALALSLPILYFQIDTSKDGIYIAVSQIVIIIVTSLTMIQSWIPMLFSYANNSAAWSISVEAFFYTAFIAIIGRIFSLNRKGVYSILIFSYFISITPPLAYYIFENKPTPGLQIFYAMPIFRLGEFVAGIALYKLTIVFPAAIRFARKIFPLLASITLLYIGSVGNALPIYVGHNWIVVPLVASTLVSCSFCRNGMNGNENSNMLTDALGSKLMIFLGKISYCFYSFQGHILYFVMFLIVDYKHYPILFMSTTLILLLLVSVFFYYVLEDPARRAVTRRFMLNPKARLPAI